MITIIIDEALAFALYERYYTDVKVRAYELTAEKSDYTHCKLLALYFAAKSMTSSEIFNKYKLNEALRSFTEKQNEILLNMIFSSLDDSRTEQEK